MDDDPDILKPLPLWALYNISTEVLKKEVRLEDLNTLHIDIYEELLGYPIIVDTLNAIKNLGIVKTTEFFNSLYLIHDKFQIEARTDRIDYYGSFDDAISPEGFLPKESTNAKSVQINTLPSESKQIDKQKRVVSSLMIKDLPELPEATLSTVIRESTEIESDGLKCRDRCKKNIPKIVITKDDVDLRFQDISTIITQTEDPINIEEVPKLENIGSAIAITQKEATLEVLNEFFKKFNIEDLKTGRARANQITLKALKELVKTLPGITITKRKDQLIKDLLDLRSRLLNE